MADIEKEKFRQIGIDLINEYRQQRGFTPIDWLSIDTPEASAFIRSIQLHEKTKKELRGVKQELHDFKQEVSDAVVLRFKGFEAQYGALEQFIIPKHDPLVEAWKHQYPEDPLPEVSCNNLRAALEARGLEIREKNDD